MTRPLVIGEVLALSSLASGRTVTYGRHRHGVGATTLATQRHEPSTRTRRDAWSGRPRARRELQRAVPGGLNRVVVMGHISEQEVRALVDEVEENGAQHIFLYRLTDAGRRNLTADKLAAAFHAPPTRLSARYYGDEPPRQQYFLNRDGILFVKQV